MSRFPTYRAFLALAAFALSTGVSHGAPRASAAAPRWNVVIIMADDLGYGDLGCYGATLVKTPHCDRLAREGRRFTDAHSPSAVCSPTRFGLLTGGYPWRDDRVPRHLHAWEPLVIREGEPTIASLLKRAGYATACVGKWHLGAQRQDPIDWNQPLSPGPNDCGFDEFFGVINSHNQAPFVLVENQTILDHAPNDPIAISDNRVQTSGPRTRDSNELEAAQARRAVDFIDRNKDRAFFLYYPTAAIHSPLAPGKSWRGTSQAGEYGDYIQEFDWAVGQVLRALDRHRLAERTIVIVTSDNGGLLRPADGFGHRSCGDLRGAKTSAYEGGHRVPFIVRWPEKVPSGTTCDETMCHVDLMATLCAALDIELPSHAGPDSWNMLPAWLGESSERPIREATVCVSQNASTYAVRRGPWKLLLPAKGDPQRVELYNLSDDLAESINLASKHPEEVEELKALFAKYRDQGFSRNGWKPASE